MHDTRNARSPVLGFRRARDDALLGDALSIPLAHFFTGISRELPIPRKQ